MTGNRAAKENKPKVAGGIASTRSDQTKPVSRPNDFTVLQQVVGNRMVQGLSANGELTGRPGALQLQPTTMAHGIEYDQKPRHEASTESEPRKKGWDIGSGRSNSVQRDDDGGGAAAGTRPRSLGAGLARASLDEIRGQATARSFMLGAYTERGTQVAQKARSKMERFSDRYSSAYQDYAGAIRAARREAQNQQQWIDVFAGIAIGVSVGLISEALVGEAILTTAEAVLVEVIGETSEAIVAGGAEGMGVIPQVVGQELEPGGLSPDLINTQIWRTIASMHSEIARIQRVSWYLPLLLGNTEYALGQLRLLEAGADTDMPEADVIDMAVSLGRANSAIRPLDELVTQKLAALDRLNAQLDATPDYPTSEIEQDIWISWMSSLPDSESDTVDLDAIEDHLTSIGVLGKGSRLGVDFGWWTSESDELEALAAARSQAGAIRAKFESMTGG